MATLRWTLAELIRRPHELVLRRWNWKSALFSSMLRALIFLAVNWRSGWRAAVGAMSAEFFYRAISAGFYGSLTQSLRNVEPAWQGTLAALVLVPLVSHSIELTIHWLRGTPNLIASIIA